MRQTVIEPMGPPGLVDWLHGFSGLAPMPMLLVFLLLVGLGVWLFRRALPFRRKARVLMLPRYEPHDDIRGDTDGPASVPEDDFGSSEVAMRRWREILVLKLRFWMRAGPGILFLILGLWVLKQAALSYPDWSAFFGALLAHPWQPVDAMR